MAAGTYNIALEQGTTYEQDFIWKDNQTTPQPIDITGYSARMQIRSTIIDTNVLMELTTGNSKIVLGTTNGKITLKLTAVETAAFAWSTGVYDLEMVSAAGVVTRILKGSVSVDPEVTR